MEKKECTYFINESKLDSFKELFDNTTRKYSLYSKYADDKIEALLGEMLMDLRELRNYLNIELLKDEGMN
jgi:hypothetical protein